MAKYRLRKSQTRVVFTGDGAKIYPVENAFHSGTRYRIRKKYYSPYVDVRRFPSKYSDYTGTWAGPKPYSNVKVIPAKRSRLSTFNENYALHYLSKGYDILANMIFKGIIAWLILISICIVFLRNDGITTGLAVDKFLLGCKSFSNWGLIVKDQFVDLVNGLRSHVVPLNSLLTANAPGIIAIPTYFHNLFIIICYIAAFLVTMTSWCIELLILLVTVLFV